MGQGSIKRMSTGIQFRNEEKCLALSRRKREKVAKKNPRKTQKYFEVGKTEVNEATSTLSAQ